MTPRAEVLATPLSVDACIRRVQHPGAGAVVVMIGLVRNHTRHDDAEVAVHKLEYEAYAEMAVAVIDAIIADCEARDGVRAAVQHRVGSLAIGDLAVVVAVSAPHRQAAFRACQAIIDRLKESAPIWKREHGDDGVVWVGAGP
jgi:molybdopterin synthase catalytic subunit